MKLKSGFLLFSCGLLAVAQLSAAEQDVITKSFDVKPGGLLVVAVDRGSINITSSDSDKVNIKVVREFRRGSASKAKQAFEAHKINMDSKGGTVEIKASNPSKGGGFFSGNLFNSLQVTYNISVPSKFDLNLGTAGGNIEISQIQGNVEANTAGGNLQFGSIDGPLKGKTSGGNITLKSATGDCELRTSGGNLQLGQVQGDLLAKTSGGNISLEQVRGSVKAETSGGNIRLQDAYGPVMAHTSGGHISARLNEQPKAECKLQTSGGNVDVTLASKLAVDLTARTSGGSVRSDFPGDLNKERTKLVAQLNGGGPAVWLETHGGNVSVKKTIIR